MKWESWRRGWETRFTTAVHEAGHAVVAHHTGMDIEWAQIEPVSVIEPRQWEGGVWIRNASRDARADGVGPARAQGGRADPAQGYEPEAYVAMLEAGRLAAARYLEMVGRATPRRLEHVRLGARTDGRKAEAISLRYGVDRAASQQLADAYLERYWSKTLSLAHELSRDEQLSGQQIRRLLSGATAQPEGREADRQVGREATR